MDFQGVNEGIPFVFIVGRLVWRNLGTIGSQNKTKNEMFPARSMFFKLEEFYHNFL